MLWDTPRLTEILLMQGLGISPLSNDAARGTPSCGPGRSAAETAGDASAEENAEKVFVCYTLVYALVVNGRFKCCQHVRGTGHAAGGVSGISMGIQPDVQRGWRHAFGGVLLHQRKT